jgi:hypothetical protein
VLNGRVVKRVLLTQDRLAAARNSDEEIDRVAQQAAMEDFV